MTDLFRHDLLLFDLDGTLSDPAVGIGRSIDHALQRHGYPALPSGQLSAWIGPPLDVGFRSLAGARSEDDVGKLVASYRERYAEIGYAENTMYPGIAEALAHLSSAGWRMAVCTSKRVDFAQRILALFGIDRHFDFVDGGDIGIHKVQQIEALRAAGRVSRQTVMIGDRAVDAQAAHGNGLSSCGVLWGHGSRQELEAERPRYLLAAPAELTSPARWALAFPERVTISDREEEIVRPAGPAVAP